MTFCNLFHMVRREPYTREQLIELILLDIQLSKVGVEFDWSRWDGARNHSDDHVCLTLNTNDLWWWGCADAEVVRPEHAKFLRDRIETHYKKWQNECVIPLAANTDSLTRTVLTDDVVGEGCWLVNCAYTCYAYVAHLREMRPENWLKYFKYVDDKYHPITEYPEHLAAYEAEEKWWKEQLGDQVTQAPEIHS